MIIRWTSTQHRWNPRTWPSADSSTRPTSLSTTACIENARFIKTIIDIFNLGSVQDYSEDLLYLIAQDYEQTQFEQNESLFLDSNVILGSLILGAVSHQTD